MFLSHEPSLSPDGRRIAHAWGGGAGTEMRIYDIETGADTVLPVDVEPPLFPLVPTWAGPAKILVLDNAGDVHLVDVDTGEDKLLPLPRHERWLRTFDTAHPWHVFARGKKPFTWGWMKSLGGVRR